MEKKMDKELGKILSLAGEILEKEYPANQLVKSVAGSTLKCLGHKGTPSKIIKEKAQQILTASEKAKNLYKEKELIIAEYVLSSRAEMRIIFTKK